MFVPPGCNGAGTPILADTREEGAWLYAAKGRSVARTGDGSEVSPSR